MNFVVQLIKYIQALEENAEIKMFFKRRLLTHSIAGNRCECLTITSPASPEIMEQRKGVFISGRVHPGETVGSWMMHGVLEFLTGNTPEAVLLRENFVFKIIPMLNPDGVINGNYRCNLSGVDLNRQWKEPAKDLHPTIFAAKKLIKNFSKEREVNFICDLHGHSRRKNVFMYGCSDPNNPKLTRTFPFLLSKISNFFLYKSCSFRMQKSKESTLRISVYKETRVFNTYTLESTFSGCDFGPKSGIHLTTEDLKQMGKDLCITIMVYNNLKLPETCQSTVPVIEKEDLIEELETNPEILTESNDDSSSGSESDPSEDNLNEQEIMEIFNPPLPKRRVSTDPKQSQKRNLKTEDHSLQPPLKMIRTKERFKKSDPKCLSCGGIKDMSHICNKTKSTFRQTMINGMAPNREGFKPKYSMTISKFRLTSSFNLASNFPIYLNPDGKKVRDQATQTVSAISPKKSETLNSVHFLAPLETSPMAGPNVSNPEPVGVINLEKIKDMLKSEKNVLPSISPSKMSTSL